MTTATAAPPTVLDVIADRTTLLDACRQASRGCATRDLRPILLCVHLQAGTSLAISGNNLEYGVVARVAALDKLTIRGTGVAVVNADLLLRTLDALTGDDVNLQVHPDGLHVGDGSADLVLRTDAKPETFPAVPLPTGDPHAHILAGVLGDLVKLVKHGLAETSSGKHYMSEAINWILEGGELELQAMGGSRIVLAKGIAPLQSVLRPGQCTLVLPEVLGLAVGSAEPDTELDVWVTPNQIFLRTPTVSVYGQLVDGKFPPLRQLMAQVQPPKATLTMQAGDLLRGFRQAALVCGKETKGVRVTIEDDTLQLESVDATAGQSCVVIEGLTITGADSVVLHAEYTIRGLAVLKPDDVISIASGGEHTFVIRRGDGYVFALMPIVKQTDLLPKKE